MTKNLPFLKKYTTTGKRNRLFPHLFHMIWNSVCIMQTIFHTNLLYKCMASNHNEMSTSIRTPETFFPIVKEMIWYTQVIVNVFDAGNHRKSSVCFHLKPSYKQSSEKHRAWECDCSQSAVQPISHSSAVILCQC